MSEIRFSPPGPDEPGYLLRSRSALAFKDRLAAKGEQMDVEMLDEMMDFLATYVKEPTAQEEKRDALLMASENQFNELLDLLAGINPKNSSPAPKNSPSDNTAKV